MNLKNCFGTQDRSRGGACRGRIQIVTLLGFLLVLSHGSIAMAQLEHGFGATKVCNPRCEGETMDCTMTGRHLDDFDDVLTLTEAWDEVSTGLGLVRVPAVGNLPIIAVVGNALCTDSGGICNPATGANCVLPCRVAQAGSNTGGMPGLSPAGRVQFRQNQYVIKVTDPNNMPDVAKFRWADECQDPTGSSSCPVGTLVTPAGSNTDVVRCNDGDTCTTDCCVNGVCSNTSVCLDTSCAAGNTPISCDDNNVCTADSCNDEAATCCDHVPIPCPALPCQRITGCNPITGCQYTFDCREPAAPGQTCCPDDGNPCTAEFCDQATGLCDEDPECVTAADCDDQNVCTTDICDGSCCEHLDIPCPVLPCFRATGCNPITGCIYVPDCRTGSLGACCPDDGNICTDEFCAQGTGVCGKTPDCVTAADCNDNDTCTSDACVNSCCVHQDIPCPALTCQRNTDCDEVAGCEYVSDCRNGPLGTCCPDDGNACTHEFCAAGTGVCGKTFDCTSAADCNDNNLCTVDSCANSCCVHTPFVCPEIPCKRLTGCDPALGCQYVDDCRNGPLGTCCPADTNPCTTATCDANSGVCGSRPDCTSAADCDDQSLCTTDSCTNSCCVHTPITCPTLLCKRSTGCDPVLECTYDDVTPCCGNDVVEPGETCDPPGSVSPEGVICGPFCKSCGDGILDDGEECDPGRPNNVPPIPPIACLAQSKPCKDVVCSDQCKCVKVPKPDGTIVTTDEFCMDFICQDALPFEHPKPNGLACGLATPQGVCDMPDSCDGKGHCNSNFKEAGTVCRPAVDECDRPEPCSGLSATCPPDTCAAAGTLATDDGEECTYDVCDGHCHRLHPPKPYRTPCGNQSSNVCDFPDWCDGHGACDMNIVTTANNCPAIRAAKAAQCMKGPNVHYQDPSCFTVDMDQDGDVDITDCSLAMDNQ